MDLHLECVLLNRFGEDKKVGVTPMRINLWQRLIFFLLSVRLMGFHRFITLKQDLEDQLRSRAIGG